MEKQVQLNIASDYPRIELISVESMGAESDMTAVSISDKWVPNDDRNLWSVLIRKVGSEKRIAIVV